MDCVIFCEIDILQLCYEIFDIRHFTSSPAMQSLGEGRAGQGRNMALQEAGGSIALQ